MLTIARTTALLGALFVLLAPLALATPPSTPNPGDPLFCQPQEGTTFIITNSGSDVFSVDADCYNNNTNNDTTLSITTAQGGSLAGIRAGSSINYIYTPPTPTFTGLDTFTIHVTTVWNGAGGTGSAGGSSRPGGAADLLITLNVLPTTKNLAAGFNPVPITPFGSVSNCTPPGNAGLGPSAT